jgi:leader peptidase (prepilin peptidase) / N-methyltransferase
VAFEPFAPWQALFHALARAAATAAALAALRFGYEQLRGREGLGLGDVKLAGGIGAWLTIEQIPLCLSAAAAAALLYALAAHMRGEAIERTTSVPFGAFLCPALWLVFYIGVVSG